MIGIATARRPAGARGNARSAWKPVAAALTSFAPTSLGDRAPHPLGDAEVSGALRRRASEIDEAFARIEPTLEALAPRQFDPDFVPRANAELAERLGFTFPDQALATSWLAPLDMRGLHASAVLRTFCRLIERAFDREIEQFSDGESAPALIARWGFHAVDITPCADGRLSGVVDFILRVPPAVVVSRQSYAGAMFDVEETLRRWETVELGRWREGRPNAAQLPTCFLKIGVYHFSSSDPHHQGCAAHGSDDARAATALLERLDAFATAVQRIHCCGAAVRTLLIGVDTDTDAIRVHVPDAAGRMSVTRFVDNRELYERTRELPREAAKSAIRDAVAACAGAAADDAHTEGMRWFCGYLLKNNIGQVDAVRAWHGGAYADRGHTERLIIVGDPIDDVQLRNLAFQAQMNTVEEGASDLDVGVRILRGLNAERGLAVPVLVHVRYDARIPGSDQHARLRARRLRAAIESRYAQLAGSGMLHVEAVVRSTDDTPLIVLESASAAPSEFSR
jgi:carboxysome shell carbonic anhydrase